ncbi:MAG: KEOPS complex subunit Cgi121 [Methanomicrobiales archaeon]|nr:KEOPS complex subunit Cgi121 [Methanomicrobiales archaeon]
MTDEFEIRSAVFRVSRCQPFLARLRGIGAARGTRIICFNADLMAGRAHAAAALRRALRAVREGAAISASLEMEALLSASGNRQCSVAERFGIHEGENRAYVCLYPPSEAAYRDLSALMEFVDEDWEAIPEEKEERLREAFGITREELAAAGPGRLRELVLERVALLEVYR